MKKIFIIFNIIYLVNVSSLFADVLLITNKEFPTMDIKSVSKVYLGKVFVIEDKTITPVMLKDNGSNESFLKEYLNLTQEQYIAYWTVRKYIGKGTPPKEFDTLDEMLSFIENTQGAIGYINKDLYKKYNTNNKLKVLN